MAKVLLVSVCVLLLACQSGDLLASLAGWSAADTLDDRSAGNSPDNFLAAHPLTLRCMTLELFYEFSEGAGGAPGRKAISNIGSLSPPSQSLNFYAFPVENVTITAADRR